MAYIALNALATEILQPEVLPPVIGLQESVTLGEERVVKKLEFSTHTPSLELLYPNTENKKEIKCQRTTCYVYAEL